MRKFVVGTLSLFFVVACNTSPQISSNTEYGYQGHPIFGGVLDTNPRHEAVVALTSGGGFAFCSGTITDRNTVITAGHCISGAGPAFVYIGTDVQVDRIACNNGNQTSCDKFIDVLDFEVHPNFGFNLDNDIAVLFIAETPDNVSPIPFLSVEDGNGFTTADENSAITFVGFGLSDGANGTEDEQRLIVDGILDQVGPTGAGPTPIGSDKVSYFQPDGGPCNGDSGGPLFIERDGIEFLGAVTSFGDQGCTVFGVSQRVDVHDEFIRAFQDANQPVPDEVCDNDVDDDGDGDTDCDDSDCDEALNCQPPPPPPAEICNDNVDNDLDGLVDCADADCASFSGCAPANELCGNGLDDDGNGFSDCDDAACASFSDCGTGNVGCTVSAPTSSSKGNILFTLFALFAFMPFMFRRRKI